MPPKAAPVVEEKKDIEGPPFVQVSLGLKDSQKVLTLNTNCPLAICIDYCKRKYIVKVKEEIASLRVNIDAISSQITPVPDGSEQVTPEGMLPPEKEKAKLEEILHKYENVLHDLTNETTVLDLLTPAGSSAECSKNLDKLGSEILQGRAIYSFCKIDADLNSPVSFVFSQGEEAPAAIVPPVKKK